jgi:hypothetical protein
MARLRPSVSIMATALVTAPAAAGWSPHRVPPRNEWLTTIAQGRGLDAVPPPRLSPASPARLQFNVPDAMRENGTFWS